MTAVGRIKLFGIDITKKRNEKTNKHTFLLETKLKMHSKQYCAPKFFLWLLYLGDFFSRKPAQIQNRKNQITWTLVNSN
jgi:hypothetical protein